MAYLQLKGIEKVFGDVRVIRGIDLAIEQGEFVVFVGPSGCGKSTLLRLIAGLEQTDGGTLTLDQRDITDAPSAKRDLAMVFQSYALYPHMSVFENMSFALKLAKVDEATIKQKVERAAKILNLTSYLQRTPKELSGGQRQRVAIGRAIVRAPKVFLFDEPLSNLDAALRGQTRIEIAKLHRDLGATTIYVTHDQVEAMTLADRVVVLRDGQIEQVGTPLELYDRPANQFVAQFIGTPQMNVVAVKDLPGLDALFDTPLAADGFIGLRPECVGLCAPAQARFTGKVELVEALGAETLIYVTTAQGAQLVSRQNERTTMRVGDAVGVQIDVDAAHVFDAKGRITRTGRARNAAVHRMLHLGLGSFHRAHQAVYLHQLQQSGDRSWTLAGGNIRPDMADTIAALIAQKGAYTLETVTPQGQRSYTGINAISEVVPHDAALSGLIRLGADAATRIISFTVTEAGYYLDAKDRLDMNFADLQADVAALKAGNSGSTLYGALTSILRARMAANAGPVTLLNCDNLRHNGDRSRSGLLQFLELIGDTALHAWVTAHTSSPNAMVDRITPRPTPAVRERVLAATGVDDAAALMGESFIQWVIEDNFIAGRPAWEQVGVEMVDSVQAYEEAKIRLLNATHSCIAWAGTLVGYTYIHEGTHDATIRQFAFDYVTDDVIPVLHTPDKPSPLNLENYRDVVLDRFGNPAIADTNQRVAMDGFSKIPGFIAPTIRERLARNESIASVAMLPALFLAYLQRWHAGQIAYTYQDQAMDAAAAHAICQAPDPVAAFCADATLWGALAADARLESAVRSAYARVQSFVQNHT